jgi:nucleotide-binding universal stress UspA family protein
MFTFNRILCPTDFSKASYQALHKAVEMASNGTTEICVVYVESFTESAPLAATVSHTSSEAIRIAEAVRNLCVVMEEQVPSHVRTQPVLKQGHPATEIVNAAREFNTDLIILTTHGAGMERAREGTLGSVTSEVLQHAPCPVLTISVSANGKQELHRPENDPARARTVEELRRPELLMTSNRLLFLNGH